MIDHDPELIKSAARAKCLLMGGCSCSSIDDCTDMTRWYADARRALDISATAALLLPKGHVAVSEENQKCFFECVDELEGWFVTPREFDEYNTSIRLERDSVVRIWELINRARVQLGMPVVDISDPIVNDSVDNQTDN